MSVEYISRKAAIKAVESVPDGNWKSIRYSKEIKSIPAADVVPVVRCGECRFCVHDQGFDELWCNGKRRKADWFCADGEKREVEHD